VTHYALPAADFKRHVDDVEAGLSRKTEELHQYRHKLEVEMSGKALSHSPASACFHCCHSADMLVIIVNPQWTGGLNL